ncbi:MAG TPA: D-glycero-beta-D-manno-heptose 1,7-bisphosphate 7-phosphatase [Malonomonas sp.]
MISAKLRPAVFLDRDGTINVEKDYLVEPAEFEFIPGVPKALKRLQDAGYLLVVVTNQSGVARGYFSLQQVERLHAHMEKLLEKFAVTLAGIYSCPHHPTAGVGEYLTACACRKGAPGMLLQAARELGIDLSRSYMIGDKQADIDAGLAAGCRSYLVRTGHGGNWLDSEAPRRAKVVADLPAAVDDILLSGSL